MLREGRAPLQRRSVSLPCAVGEARIGVGPTRRAHLERRSVSSPASFEHARASQPQARAVIVGPLERRPLTQRSVSDNIIEMARRDVRAHSRQLVRHSLSENNALFLAVESPSEEDDDAPAGATQGGGAIGAAGAFGCDDADEDTLNASFESSDTGYRTQPNTPSPFTMGARSRQMFSDDDTSDGPAGRALWSPSGVASGVHDAAAQQIAEQRVIMQQQHEYIERVTVEQLNLVAELRALQRYGATVGPPPAGYGWHPDGWVPLMPHCRLVGNARGSAHAGLEAPPMVWGWGIAATPPFAPLTAERRDSSSTASDFGAAHGSSPDSDDRAERGAVAASRARQRGPAAAARIVRSDQQRSGRRKSSTSRHRHWKQHERLRTDVRASDPTAAEISATSQLHHSADSAARGGMTPSFSALSLESSVSSTNSTSTQSTLTTTGSVFGSGRRPRRRGKRGGRRGRAKTRTGDPAAPAADFLLEST
jgi:hypothetical protein